MLCIRAVKGDAVDGVCPEEEEGGGGDGWTVTPAARVDGVSGRDEELITLPPLADDPCSPFASDLWNWMTFASACAMAASEGVWLSCNDECALVEIRGAVSAVQVTGWGLAVVMTGRREAVEIGWRIGTAGERGLAVTGCGAVERGRRIVGAMAVGGWEVTVDGEEIVLLASLELSSSESESRQITSTLSPPPPVGPVFPLQLPILAWLLLLPAPPLLLLMLQEPACCTWWTCWTCTCCWWWTCCCTCWTWTCTCCWWWTCCCTCWTCTCCCWWSCAGSSSSHASIGRPWSAMKHWPYWWWWWQGWGYLSWFRFWRWELKRG